VQIMWFFVRKGYLWHFLVEWPFKLLHGWLYRWGLRDIIVTLKKRSRREEFGESTSELRSLGWPLLVSIKTLLNVYYLLSALYVHVSVLFTELCKMVQIFRGTIVLLGNLDHYLFNLIWSGFWGVVWGFGLA
jgi:hypothetical protein